MTKSTITREESIQAVFDLKVGYTLGLADIETLKRVARMALAAMDSEPVALQPELAKVIYHFRDWNEGFPVERFKADYVISWMLANYPPAQPAKDREQVRREHAEWSQATFGNVGPVGPLKHLAKEAMEAAAEPDDLSEWADMQFLLWDAQRRAGITDEQITKAMIEKLAVNKQRSWPEPKDGEPRLHIKAQPAPVVPDAATAIRACLSEFPESARDIVEECADIAENACRAAMLNHPEQHLDMVDHYGDVNEKGGDGNSPVIPDGWTCNDKANAALMMLDRIETVDPVDDDRIDGIKRIVRELAAAPHDTHALNSVQSVVTVPGEWIPVSERIPDNTEPVLCIEKRADFGTYGQPFVCWHDGGGWVGKTNYRPIVTHWMPLPAAPQEVKGE